MRGSRPAASSPSSGRAAAARDAAHGRATEPAANASRAPLLAGVALGALAACGSKPEEPRVPPLGRILAAVLVAADDTLAPWRCAAADTPGLADAELKAGEHTWKASGNTLSLAEGSGELVIGVVADAAGSDSRTIAALGRLRAAFDAAGTNLVLSLGGMGSTAAELEATLGTLGDRARWPIVALPGDLERESAHRSAIASLRKRGDLILDARQVRYVTTPTFTIGTLPGAGAVERLAAGTDGCAWTATDVSAVYTALTQKPGVRIVATAEAPRVTVDGEAAGELALVPPKPQPIELALHAPVRPEPTPAKSGGRDGRATLLTPGTSDATTRLPRTHRPAAGILTIRGTSWAWRPVVDANR